MKRREFLSRALHWWVAEAVNIYKCVKPDEWCVNCSRVQNVDATDPESMTMGEIEGRKQIQQLMNFFHKYVPGCEIECKNVRGQRIRDSAWCGCSRTSGYSSQAESFPRIRRSPKPRLCVDILLSLHNQNRRKWVHL